MLSHIINIIGGGGEGSGKSAELEECDACRYTGGLGLASMGALGIYQVAGNPKWASHPRGKAIIYVLSGCCFYLGSARVLRLWPFSTSPRLS